MKESPVATTVEPGSIWASEDGDIYILCFLGYDSGEFSKTNPRRYMAIRLSDGMRWDDPAPSIGEAVEGLILKFVKAKISVEPYES